jgi:hypothetical protein
MQLWKLPCHGNATPVTHRHNSHLSAVFLHPCPTLRAADVAAGHDVDLALLTVLTFLICFSFLTYLCVLTVLTVLQMLLLLVTTLTWLC